MIHIYIDHASIFSCSFPDAPFFCGLWRMEWTHRKTWYTARKTTTHPSASAAHSVDLIAFGFVRYIYIPLGGTHRIAATNILAFTFVALWHGVSLRLLAWG
jgi:MBOAT, membrane-bound O-acyltransferase family